MNSSNISAGTSEQIETIKVCIKPTSIGASNSSTKIPIKIICRLQKRAQISTRVSPRRTVASWKFVRRYAPKIHKNMDGQTLQ